MANIYVGQQSVSMYKGDAPEQPIQMIYENNEAVYNPENITPSGNIVKLWMPMDTNSNDTVENRVATVNSATIDSSVKAIGAGSLATTGGSDSVSISVPTIGDTNYTISFWIYQTSANTNKVILSSSDYADNDSGEFVFGLDSAGKLYYKYASTHISLGTSIKQQVLSSSAVATNAWVHVAVVRENSGGYANSVTRLFIDGVSQGVVTQSNASSYDVEPIRASGITVGADEDAANGFSGNIDNVRIHNFALYKNGTSFTPSTTTPAP